METAKADGSVEHEGWRVREDGSRPWADATLSASYDDAGTLRGFGQMIRESTRTPVEQ